MRTRKYFLSFCAFILSLQTTSLAYGEDRSFFLGTHHAKGEQHEEIIKMIKECKGSPLCSPTGPFASLLGIVIEFKEEGYHIFQDSNLVKRELGLLKDKPYEPQRRSVAKGRWGFGRGTLTIIRKDNSDEEKKFIYKLISSEEGVIYLRTQDEREEIQRLEKL